MKAVDHNRRVRQNLLHGGAIALPHVGADRSDLGADGGRDGLEPRDHAGFAAIGQHGQHVQIAACGLGADDGHKITMAFEECNLVDTHRRERFEGIPIDGGGDPAIQDAQERIIRDILLRFDIGERAID
jgi:hypothetical protein